MPGSFLSTERRRQILDAFKKRQHLYLPDERLGQMPVFTLDDLDVYLSSHPLPVSSVNVYRDCAEIPVQQWSRVVGPPERGQRLANRQKLMSLFGSGCTVIVNGVHRTFDRLKKVCDELECELGLPTQANIYLTRRSGRGFPRHADEHEVLVLQVHGRKKWDVYVGAGDRNEIVLNTGDLLYLPRGVEHQATAEDHDSIHVSFGLKPVYMHELVEQLAQAARRDPIFLLPVAADSEGATSWEKDFLRHVAALTARMEPARLLAQCRQQRLIDRGGSESVSVRDLLRLDEITLNTSLRANVGMAIDTTGTASEIAIRLGDEEIVVASFLRQALEDLAAGKILKVRDIEGLLTDEGRVQLSRELVCCGAVNVVEFAPTEKGRSP